MAKNTEAAPLQTIANQTAFELITGFRRETGNQFKLLGVLMMGLMVPVLLVLLTLVIQNAASNLENRRFITAFTAGTPAPAADTLRESLINHHQIERATVVPATDNLPMIVEIKPIVSLTDEQTESLVKVLESSGEFTFVSVNDQLLKRNTNAYLKAKKLALVFFLIALVLAASTCLLVMKREILRSNSTAINLQRQLGATPSTISKPYIARAALLTLMAMIGAAGLVTVFYKTATHIVDVSPYSTLLHADLPIPHLILLGIVSVAAACFATTTALQINFTNAYQLVRGNKSKFKLSNQPIIAEY